MANWIEVRAANQAGEYQNDALVNTDRFNAILYDEEAGVTYAMGDGEHMPGVFLQTPEEYETLKQQLVG